MSYSDVKLSCWFFCFVPLFLGGGTIMSQSISGNITEGESLEPVVGAHIILHESSNRRMIKFGTSNIDGAYSIALPEEIDSFYLTCQYIGFEKYEKKFARLDTLINITMTSSSYLLNEIVVKAIPTGVHISGDTTSYRVSNFQNGNESNIKEVLQKLPGFEVESGDVKYQGRRIDKILLEGDDFMNTQRGSLLTHLDNKGLDRVQIIDNDDELRLNLQVKEDNKNRVNVSGIALTSFFSKYNVEASLYRLDNKLKIVSTYADNNVGIDVIGIEDYIGLIDLNDANTDRIEIPSIFTAESEAQSGEQRFWSNNLSWTPSESDKFVANIYHFGRNTLANSTNSIFRLEVPFFNQLINSANQLSATGVNLRYNHDISAKWDVTVSGHLFKETNNSTASDLQSFDQLTISTDAISENDLSLFSSTIDLTYNLGDKNSFTWSLGHNSNDRTNLFSFSTTPNRSFIIDGVTTSLSEVDQFRIHNSSTWRASGEYTRSSNGASSTLTLYADFSNFDFILDSPTGRLISQVDELNSNRIGIKVAHPFSVRGISLSPYVSLNHFNRLTPSSEFGVNLGINGQAKIRGSALFTYFKLFHSTQPYLFENNPGLTYFENPNLLINEQSETALQSSTDGFLLLGLPLFERGILAYVTLGFNQTSNSVSFDQQLFAQHTINKINQDGNLNRYYITVGGSKKFFEHKLNLKTKLRFSSLSLNQFIDSTPVTINGSSFEQMVHLNSNSSSDIDFDISWHNNLQSFATGSDLNTGNFGSTITYKRGASPLNISAGLDYTYTSVPNTNLLRPKIQIGYQLSDSIEIIFDAYDFFFLNRRISPLVIQNNVTRSESIREIYPGYILFGVRGRL